MKFCTNCGTQLPDEAYVCNQCGTAMSQASVQQNYTPPQQGYVPPQQQGYAPQQGYVPPQQQGYAPQQGYVPPQGYAPQQAYAPRQESGLTTAAKIFMIIGTVGMSLGGFLIPLAWCLPMTITYCNKLKRGEPIGTGFKVCSLLFVNTIAGILMLCDNKN